MSKGVSSIYHSKSPYIWRSGKHNQEVHKNRINTNRKVFLSELQIVDVLQKIEANLRNDYQDWDQKFILSVKEQLVEKKKKRLSEKQLSQLRRIVDFKI